MVELLGRQVGPNSNKFINYPMRISMILFGKYHTNWYDNYCNYKTSPKARFNTASVIYIYCRI